MKKFVTGFIVGAIICSMLGAFAVSYVANPVNFKVLVNGEEFVSDPPALEVNGRTYLPLRAMGEALGVPVNWNQELFQAEVGTTPTSKVQNTTVTLGMKNALAKAHSYLNVMPFSYKGLIEQLEYEEFSTIEATYAADNCGANWNEQAAKMAENYLNTMAFSKDGLIKQLEYEGFTHEQSLYGVSAVGY